MAYIHSIVLAVNNPSQEEVDRVVNMHIGSEWKAVWCADRASLKQVPPAEGRIRYIVLGSSGSLTMQDIAPHIAADWRDVAVFGYWLVKQRFGFTNH